MPYYTRNVLPHILFYSNFHKNQTFRLIHQMWTKGYSIRQFTIYRTKVHSAIPLRDYISADWFDLRWFHKLISPPTPILLDPDVAGIWHASSRPVDAVHARQLRGSLSCYDHKPGSVEVQRQKDTNSTYNIRNVAHVTIYTVYPRQRG